MDGLQMSYQEWTKYGMDILSLSLQTEAAVESMDMRNSA